MDPVQDAPVPPGNEANQPDMEAVLAGLAEVAIAEPFVSPNRARPIVNPFHRTPSMEHLYAPSNTLSYTELIPGSNVYINKGILQLCIERAGRATYKHNVLVKALMGEIFTDQALRVCSFSGSEPIAYGREATDTRPALDRDAREAILAFALAHGRRAEWRQDDKTETSAREAMKSELKRRRGVAL